MLWGMKLPLGLPVETRKLCLRRAPTIDFGLRLYPHNAQLATSRPVLFVADMDDPHASAVGAQAGVASTRRGDFVGTFTRDQLQGLRPSICEALDAIGADRVPMLVAAGNNVSVFAGEL